MNKTTTYSCVLGCAIAYLRAASDTTQEELAESSGTSRATIAAVEAGIQDCMLGRLQDFAFACNQLPIELFSLAEKGAAHLTSQGIKVRYGFIPEVAESREENLLTKRSLYPLLRQFWKQG